MRFLLDVLEHASCKYRAASGLRGNVSVFRVPIIFSFRLEDTQSSQKDYCHDELVSFDYFYSIKLNLVCLPSHFKGWLKECNTKGKTV
jgi:hypothetical protein